MSFPIYIQNDSMDCGPTCLRMIAKHYGKPLPQQMLRDRTQINRDGVNLLGISEAAESIGFRTMATRISIPQLSRDCRLPAILHWNQNHFVVIHKIKKKKYYIADPAGGLITYNQDDFKKSWISTSQNGTEEGIALMLEPGPAFYSLETDEEEIQESGKTGMAFKNIFLYLVPHKKLLVQILLGLGLGSLLQLFLPFLTQSVVDTGINTGNIHFIYIILFAQLALFAGRMAVEFVRGWILLHISTRINLSILTDFLIKLMKLPVAFFDSKKTGDILQRMNDHHRIENFLTGSSLTVLFSLINLIVFSVILALFNSGIFTVFALAAVLYACWVLVFLKKRKKLDYKRFEVAAREQSVTIQLVQGMQEIKLNGVERSMRWTWEGLQARLFRLSMKGLTLNQWQQAGASFINEGKNIFITFLSAKAVIDGQMTLGTMLAVQYMIGQLNSPIEQLIGFLQSWQNAKISMDRLNEIHKLEDEEPQGVQLLQQLPPSFTMQLAGGKQPLAFPPLAAQASDMRFVLQEHDAGLPSAETSSIAFKQVSFTYPGAGNEPVLNNISFQIPKGKTTAIVGTSGSGKTSLLKLLLKFYEPQKGSITIGETNLSNISHKAWRSHCGVVMQESFIFSDSIARNIAVGNEPINMQRLDLAVTMANLKEFINQLPLGFNTRIGAEGNGISMGQKQRILIARAVYRNPDILFFDEATNSLDANNERIILENLESFLKGRTVIVVAHRLSTVRNADQVVVLNKGVISEKGTHQELISLKGEYYHLVKNQLELGD